jgi:hypothetical protein
MEPLAFTSILRPEGLWSKWGKFIGNGFFELVGFCMGQFFDLSLFSITSKAVGTASRWILFSSFNTKKSACKEWRAHTLSALRLT